MHVRACPNCKAGGFSWHGGGGRPVVDVRKFPNMSDLVAYGHSLGLKVGGYMYVAFAVLLRANAAAPAPDERGCSSPVYPALRPDQS